MKRRGGSSRVRNRFVDDEVEVSTDEEVSSDEELDDDELMIDDLADVEDDADDADDAIQENSADSVIADEADGGGAAGDDGLRG